MDVKPLSEIPHEKVPADVKKLDLKNADPQPDGKVAPGPSDLWSANGVGTARVSVPLVGGADKDHDGKIDRAVWESLADLMGLKEIEGKPLSEYSDAQVRREVLNLMGIDRVTSMELSEEEAMAVVQGKVKEMIGQAADDHGLYAKQCGYKPASLRVATQAYRDLYYGSHRLAVEDRVADWQRAYRDLTVARAALSRLGSVAVQLFPITEIIKPQLDIAVHPPKLPEKPPANVEEAMAWERKHPPRKPEDPFKGDLWEAAKGRLTNKDRQGGSALTSSEFKDLAALACLDGVVLPEERELLLLLLDGDNVDFLEKAARSGKAVDKGHLHPADPDESFVDGKSKGVWLDDLLDQTLAARQIGGGAGYSTADLQKEARGAKIKAGGTYDLATRDGRWRILDMLSQQAQGTTNGDSSCAATSMVALAINEGEPGVRNLCLALLRENPQSEPAKRVLEKLQAGGLTVMDLGELAESLYVTLNAQEIKKGDSTPGLMPETSWGFLRRNQDLVHVLFDSGSSLMSMDTDGDARRNHMVAVLHGPGGKEMVFEPSETHDGHDDKGFGWSADPNRKTSHHLLNEPRTLRRYRLAGAEYFQVLNPKTEKLLKS